MQRGRRSTPTRTEVPYRRREKEKERCRENCKICAGCGGRNYERCYKPCRACDSCTRFYDPYYDSPYQQRWQGWAGYTSRRLNPYSGGLTSQGHYYNATRPALSECGAVCNSQVCRVHENRKDKYEDCLENSEKQVCNDRWGCKSRRGFLHPNTPPINPKRTGCVGCWQSGYTTW